MQASALVSGEEHIVLSKLREKLDEQEYPVVRDWPVQLMHPEAGSRVTARAALEAGVVTAKSERLTSHPTLVSVSYLVSPKGLKTFSMFTEDTMHCRQPAL